jgi:hypothetical protein
LLCLSFLPQAESILLHLILPSLVGVIFHLDRIGIKFATDVGVPEPDQHDPNEPMPKKRKKKKRKYGRQM